MSNVLKILYGKKSVYRIMTSVYEGADFSLEEIKDHLNNFPGGSVDITLDDESGIANLCLNHPEKKNAISGKMMVDLDNAVSQLESWKAGKALLIYGAENNFCSGGDLDFAEKTANAEGGYKMAKFMQHVLTRLQQLPMISVAFIEGFALGGGAELAIHCDFRVLAVSAAVGFVHGRMGVMPAWGGLRAATQALGYRQALDLLLTARLVRGAEAHALGLADALVDDRSGAVDWLAERTRADVSVVRAVKCAAQHTRLCADHCAALDHERRLFAPLWGGPANKLAISRRLKHNTQLTHPEAGANTNH